METLHTFLTPLFQSVWFNRIVGFIALLNPLMLAPMLFATLEAGVAPAGAESFYIAALLQVVFSLVAIQQKNKLMFISMVVSIVMSLTIAVM